MTIKSFGLTENQVAQAVSMWADDNLTGNLYSLHAVLCDKNVRDNILSVDENAECGDGYLDEMVKFIQTLDLDDEVYAVLDRWSSRQSVQIEGIIAFNIV